MFIRESVKKVKGQKYIQHHLIESVRTPAGPRQKLIHNLGQLTLPKEKWKELANAIESELHNQPFLFTLDPEIKKLSKYYKNQIIEKQLIQEAEEITGQEESEYETVDTNSLKLEESRTLGPEHVVVNQMKEYNLDNILKGLDFSEEQINYAKMLITSRMAHPSSERETARWINENSSILELLKTNQKVYDNALHRTAIKLWEKHKEIEQRLSEEACKRFSLKETIILYDLTNTYFEGSKQGSHMAKIGRSKDSRNDRPLITLALIVDEEGFPKKSKILEGNISEPGTLEMMLKGLPEYPEGLFVPAKTIVMDAGIATDENIEMIKNNGFKYVAVSRKKSYADDFWKDSQEKEIKLNDKKSTLKIKSIKTKDETYLLCFSEQKEAKEKAIIEKKFNKFEGELNKLQEGLKKKGTRKKYEKIIERVGRLKEKYGVGNCYNIQIKHEEGITTDINYSKNKTGVAKEQKVGEYVLRTNRTDLTDVEISKMHRSLSTVEDSFRSMKSHLGIRPNYHKRDDTSIAHLFITVIAYHIMIAIIYKLRTSGIFYNWTTTRNVLASHTRSTVMFNTVDGDTINIRVAATPTHKQQNIYDALAITDVPLKPLKSKIPLKKCSDENNANNRLSC